MTGISAAIEYAVAAVRDHFAGYSVEVVPDGTGGAFVVVRDVHVGDQYVPARTPPVTL